MKYTIYIILMLLLIQIDGISQDRINFQDKLSDYIINREYADTGFPFLEYENECDFFAVFYFIEGDKTFMIITKNSVVLFVEVWFLPSHGKRYFSDFFLDESSIDELRNFHLYYLRTNSKDDYLKALHKKREENPVYIERKRYEFTDSSKIDFSFSLGVGDVSFFVLDTDEVLEMFDY